MAVSIRKRAISELAQADCLSSDEIRDVVRVTGPSVSGVFQVEKIDITEVVPELSLGVIISKPTPTRCTVQVGGQLVGLYGGLMPGRMLFVGDDAKLTHVVPTHPTMGVKYVYHAAVALDEDVLLLNFQSPFMLRP